MKSLLEAIGVVFIVAGAIAGVVGVLAGLTENSPGNFGIGMGCALSGLTLGAFFATVANIADEIEKIRKHLVPSLDEVLAQKQPSQHQPTYATPVSETGRIYRGGRTTA